MIIIAEEEDTARLSLADLLRDEGYKVFAAASTTSVVSYLETHSGVELILLDLEMPQWPRVLTHPQTLSRKPYVIGMVRPGSLPNVTTARDLGVDEYLVKPILFESVQEKVSRAFAARSISRIDLSKTY